MLTLFGRAADGLLELLYPRRAVCVGCGDASGLERDWLCERCRQALAERWVGATTPPDGQIEGAAAAYTYGDPASGMVRALKYGGVRLLTEPMGRHMVRALEGLQPVRADCVVPVPMHRVRLRERGFNHAALLAGEVARALELPVCDALERVRNTPQQVRLDDAERRRNLEGAIAIREEVTGRRVLLVDDVVTTGATAGACAGALLSGGAQAVILLCFAKAGRKEQ